MPPSDAHEAHSDPRPPDASVRHPGIERLVAIVILGALALTVVVGGLLLTWRDSEAGLPTELVAIGSAAAGALTGLIVGGGGRPDS